jgi:hypothetical protein
MSIVTEWNALAADVRDIGLRIFETQNYYTKSKRLLTHANVSPNYKS